MVDFADMYPTLLDYAGVDSKTITGLDGKSFFPLLEVKPFKRKEYIFSYLEMERTVRSKGYMMDGSGGIWRCSSNGNILDYEAVAESDETWKIRTEFMNYIKQFPIPTVEKFDKARIEKATRKHTFSRQWRPP